MARTRPARKVRVSRWMFECDQCPKITWGPAPERELIIGHQYYILAMQYDAMNWMDLHKPTPNRFATLDEADLWLHRKILEEPYVTFKELPPGCDSLALR